MKCIKKLKSFLVKKDDKPSNIVDFPKASDEEKDESESTKTIRLVHKRTKEDIIKENNKRFRRAMLKLLMVFIIYIMAFAFAFMLDLENDKLTQKYNELKAEYSELNVKYQTLSEKLSKVDDVTTENGSDTKISIDEKSLYYGKNYTDVIISYKGNEEVITLLQNISNVEYTKAGSSLQKLRAGYDFVVISQMDIDKWQVVSDFVDTLTPVQLDYLSFRVIDAYKIAFDIINGEKSLYDLGIESTSYQNCSEFELIRFLNYMFTIFDEKNVAFEFDIYDISNVINQ